MPRDPLIRPGRAGGRAALLALALLGGLPLAPAAASDLCSQLASEIERREGIPPGLVQAVALAESGRWLAEQRRAQPWPWTVTASTDSYVLPSKAAALAKVRELRAAGRTNIDVGCMQVNLGYHGHAFGTLEDALDPLRNVSYGAHFLKRLRLETRSWARATARYHSSDPERGRAYRAKVYRLWHQLREREAARQQVIRAGSGREQGEAEIVAEAAGAPAPRRLWSPGDLGPAARSRPGGIEILRGR